MMTMEFLGVNEWSRPEVKNSYLYLITHNYKCLFLSLLTHRLYFFVVKNNTSGHNNSSCEKKIKIINNNKKLILSNYIYWNNWYLCFWNWQCIIGQFLPFSMCPSNFWLVRYRPFILVNNAVFHIKVGYIRVQK